MSDVALEVEDGKSRRVERKGRGPTPEDQIAEVKNTLGKRADAAEATAATAIKQRNDMAATALATVENTLNERESRIASDITVAERALESAETALENAINGGDGKAQIAASRAQAEAMADLKIARIAKANFETQKPQLLADAKKAAEPVAAPVDNSASEQWIASRPRFNQTKDPAYYAVAITANNEAKAAGLKANTKPYFDYIDGKLAASFGADHMHEDGGGQTRQTRTMREPDHTSSGAPVGREGTDGYSSARHNLRLGQDAEGKTTISGTIPKEWVEAASWNGMTPAAYAISQLEIEHEGAAGNGGYTVNGQTAVYR